jgi:hypothetical protein
MNRLEYDKERGIPLEENLYEQSQTEIKQLLMKLFAVSSIYRNFGCPEQLQPTKPPNRGSSHGFVKTMGRQRIIPITEL